MVRQCQLVCADSDHSWLLVSHGLQPETAPAGRYFMLLSPYRSEGLWRGRHARPT
jgi:hypothetical protein